MNQRLFGVLLIMLMALSTLAQTDSTQNLPTVSFPAIDSIPVAPPALPDSFLIPTITRHVELDSVFDTISNAFLRIDSLVMIDTLFAWSYDSLPPINRDSLAAFALRYLGAPYRFGSCDPKKGFDCSGFVCFVFKQFNREVPRSSRGFRNFALDVKPEECKVGDVVVFNSYVGNRNIGHVGIVVEANGKNSKFIHATSRRTNKVMVSDLSHPSHAKRFIKFVNVVDYRPEPAKPKTTQKAGK